MVIKPVDTFDYVVFGGTGDLTLRKLLPALYHRFRDQQFGDDCRIVAAARSDLDDGKYRARAEQALREHVAKEDQDKRVMDRFLGLLHYARGDATNDGGLQNLSGLLEQADDRVRVFYMATSPDLYGPTCLNLQAAGLANHGARVVLRHALRNALAPAVALFGLDFGALVGGGTLLVEVVFGLHGIGKLTNDALQSLDLAMVMEAVLYAAFFVVLANALVDAAQAMLDPRRR